MRTTAVVSLILLAAVAAPALAEEIIYFTDGDSMAIRSHKIDGEMIQADLGGNAFIGFPMEKVERIESAEGQNVFLSPSDQSNQMFESVPDSSGNHPVRGRRPSRYSKNNDRVAPAPYPGKIQTDSNGMAVYRKFADTNHAGKRRLGTVGSGPIYGAPAARPGQGNGLAGTRAVGRSRVLGSSVPPGTKAQVQLTGLTRRDTSAAPKPKPQKDK